MASNHPGLIPRRAIVLAQRRLDAGRVVVVNGPRQSGKTALLGILRNERGGDYVSLDDATDLRSAQSDPGGFLADLDRPTFIDEIQRGGDPLVLAVKAVVDQVVDRGQFVLAGSTRFLTEPRLSESLAGRVRFVDLWPLSQGEIDSTSDSFVDDVFADLHTVAHAKPLRQSRAEIFARVCRGGFPEAVLAESDLDRREFFADYIRTVTTRDVREIADLEHVALLRSLVQLLAAQTSSELNIADLGRRVGIPAPTLRRYLPLLETVFLHHAVPAWTRNLTAKISRRPKLYLVDSGLAAHLMGAVPDALARVQAVNAGALLETFVAGELARQLTWCTVQASLNHWRDHDGSEVDLVLEAADGRVIGLEVKAAVDIGPHDFKGLRLLRRRVGPDFVAGIVLHCADRGRQFGDGMYGLPISSLWDGPSS
jgi:uncharacterized protein